MSSISRWEFVRQQSSVLIQQGEGAGTSCSSEDNSTLAEMREGTIMLKEQVSSFFYVVGVWLLVNR